MGGKLKFPSEFNSVKKLLAENDFLRLELALESKLAPPVRKHIQEIIDGYLFWDFLRHTSDAGPIQKFFQSVTDTLEKAEMLMAVGPKTNDPHADHQIQTIFDSARSYRDDPNFSGTFEQVKAARVNYSRALKDLNERWVVPAKRGPTPDYAFNRMVANLASCLNDAGISPTLTWREGTEAGGSYASPFLSFVEEIVRLLPDEMQARETTLETHVRSGLDLWRSNVRKS